MKNWLKMIALSLMTMAFCGCEDDDFRATSPYLEVTPNNLAGEWVLQQWCGAPLAEGSFVYLDLVRKGCTYTLYQNLDSFSTRRLTGRYYVETDPELGAVIRGNYDFSGGDWSDRYVVTNLTADAMIWTAVGNPQDVSFYVRAEIPTEILEAYPPMEEE